MKLPLFDIYQHSLLTVLFLISAVVEIFLILIRFGALKKTKSLYLKQIIDLLIFFFCSFLFFSYSFLLWEYTFSAIPGKWWFWSDELGFFILFFIQLIILTRCVYLIANIFYTSTLEANVLSLKEAIDNLPDGIIFSNQNGEIKMTNNTAVKNFYEWTDQELWNAQPFIELGNQNVEINEKIWKIVNQPLDTSNEKQIIQITTTDITKIQKMLIELENQKVDHESKKHELNEVLANLKEIKRQEALLQARYDIHAQLGYTVSVIDRIRNSDLIPSAKTAKISEIFSSGIMLQNNNFSEKLEDLIESLAKLNLQIEVKGKFKFDPIVEKELLSILREAAINAVRHGNATKLLVEVKFEGEYSERYSNEFTVSERKKGKYIIIISNEGTIPESTIKEGSGIASMRKTIENLGGMMTIDYENKFTITLFIPNFNA